MKNRKNILKRILACVMIVVMTLAAVPMSGLAGLGLPMRSQLFSVKASAVTEYTSGYYTYTVSNGYATITGCDTSISGAVTIPSTLGGYTVINIGQRAFENCEKMTELTIPKNIVRIGAQAFFNCEGLADVHISEGVMQIASMAFALCTSLTSVTIPKSVIDIGDGIFTCCMDLEYISVDSSNNFFVSVNGVLFNKEKSRLICFPAGSSVTSYTVPSGVETIADWAFSGNMKLSVLKFPSSVTTLGMGAIYGCRGLSSITIPKNVNSIGELAFAYDENLRSIIVESTNSSFVSLDGVLFNKAKTRLICYPTGKQDLSYEITNGVNTVESWAFACCTALKSITIPKSVTSIGDYAFEDCVGLVEAEYRGTPSDWSKITVGDENTCLTKVLTYHTLHTDENDDGACDICGGRVSEIYPDQTKTINIPEGQTVYLLYIAPYTGTYTFTSLSSYDTYGYICDENKNVIADDDDEGTDRNFLVSCTLEAGKTYYLGARFYFEDVSGSVNVKLTSNHTHVFSDWNIKTQADCTRSGEKKRMCTVCGKPETQTVSALGHSYSSTYTVDTAATCTSNGSKSRHCTRSGCDAITDVTTVYATGHIYDNTCDTVCNACGVARSITHSYGSWQITKEATCTSTGTKQRTCRVCGHIEIQTVDRTHSYGSWNTTKQETCTQSGSQRRICSLCGSVQTQDIPASGHDWVFEPGYEPTCDEWGRTDSECCSVCGELRYETESIPPTGHKYYEEDILDNPTCTQSGTVLYFCSECGADKTEPVPALGHSYSTAWTVDKQPTCTATGSKSHHCTRCPAKKDVTTIAAVGHKLNITVTPATTSRNGKTVKTCTVCRKRISSQTVYSIQTVSLSKTVYYCNGKNVTPSVIVKDAKGKTLKNGTDYTVTYPKNRKNPGTYSVKVAFKGNYSGSKTLKFKLQPGTVTGLKKISYKGYQLALQWNRVSKATGYEVQRYDSKKKKWVVLGTANATKIGFKQMPGTNKWRIRAVMTVGNKKYYGDYSKTLTTKS